MHTLLSTNKTTLKKKKIAFLEKKENSVNLLKKKKLAFKQMPK